MTTTEDLFKQMENEQQKEKIKIPFGEYPVVLKQIRCDDDQYNLNEDGEPFQRVTFCYEITGGEYKGEMWYVSYSLSSSGKVIALTQALKQIDSTLRPFLSQHNGSLTTMIDNYNKSVKGKAYNVIYTQERSTGGRMYKKYYISPRNVDVQSNVTE